MLRGLKKILRFEGILNTLFRKCVGTYVITVLKSLKRDSCNPFFSLFFSIFFGRGGKVNVMSRVYWSHIRSNRKTRCQASSNKDSFLGGGGYRIHGGEAKYNSYGIRHWTIESPTRDSHGSTTCMSDAIEKQTNLLI